MNTTGVSVTFAENCWLYVLYTVLFQSHFNCCQIEGFDSKRPDDHQLKGVEDEEFVRWEYKPPTNGAAKNSVGAESKAKVEQQKGGGKKATSSEVDNQNNAKEKHGIVSPNFI